MENVVEISRAIATRSLESGVNVLEQATDELPAGTILFPDGGGQKPINMPAGTRVAELKGWMRNSNLEPNYFQFQAYEEIGAGTAGPESRHQFLGVASDFYFYGRLHNLWGEKRNPQVVATEIAGEIAQRTAEGAPATRAPL